MKFKVTLISKDLHKYSIEVEADIPEKAIDKAMEKIVENGWSHYNYKLYEILILE